MMKIFLFALLLAFFTQCTSAQTFKPEYGAPLVVLVEKNPWLTVIGSDVPTFVLYENGQTIYKKAIGNKIKFFKTSIPKKEIPAEIKKLGVTDSLQTLPSYIAAMEATDQPTSELIINYDFRAQINVYGSLRYEKSPAREKTPSAFLKVFDKLIHFKDAKAKEWLPDSIEVMLTSYSYSPETPINWPTQWPDLKDKHTVQRSVDLYSVYIDRKELDKLKKLISSLGEKQAVKVSGRLFSIAYRLPYPNIK
ncbi:hypothetical protein AAFN85_06700 [Mucilaginibacter sp. CAU 1740]|uniref:hypothetical protein n=1 Tax=Mucilaginibacter sp. CAU 1740 TaxID=3140365 RepID=UPI00325BEE4D